MNNIITISGDPGSGKSTVRNALKEYFEKEGKKVVIYSTGDIFRGLAEDRNMTVTEFNEFLQEHECNIDDSIDSAVIKLGNKVRKQNDENKIYLVDSRLAWHNIPDAFKVRLTITDRIAGERVFRDTTRGEEDQYKTLEDAIEATRARKLSERERYIELYGEDVDICNEKNFDININTAFVEPNKIAELIIDNMKKKEQGWHICKNWGSPKLFIPTQSLNDTMYRLDDVKKSIENKGYYPTEDIEVIMKNGMYFILDGHHRCIAAAGCNISLIPYYLKSKDGNDLSSVQAQIETIKTFFGERYRSVLYDYEEIWRDKKTKELTYSYEDTYPGIYGLTKEANYPGEEDR